MLLQKIQQHLTGLILEEKRKQMFCEQSCLQGVLSLKCYQPEVHLMSSLALPSALVCLGGLRINFTYSLAQSLYVRKANNNLVQKILVLGNILCPEYFALEQASSFWPWLDHETHCHLPPTPPTSILQKHYSLNLSWRRKTIITFSLLLKEQVVLERSHLHAPTSTNLLLANTLPPL